MEHVDKNGAKNPTQIAVLGTLAEFHRDPLPYDLTALVDLVAAINPDLLCLDISLEQWQQQDFSSLPVEYSEALLPLADQTDIVVVPIGGSAMMPQATAVGWRGVLIGWVRQLLAWIQATAPSPDAINQGWRHELGNVLYGLARTLAGSAVNHAYHAHIEQLSQAAQRAAENNPGSRILVVTNIQYCHHIRPQLQQAGLTETTYKDL
ncbi:MAG: hypothetical protein IPM53_20170 [Anaerolineaceae bacterium]|nr:hypothetical protein [Anaerolineaceae bacterium]